MERSIRNLGLIFSLGFLKLVPIGFAQSSDQIIADNQKLRERAHTAHDSRAEADALRRLAQGYEVAGQPSNAQASLEQAMSISSAIHDQLGTADARTILGRVLNEIGQPRSAEKYLSSALAMDRTIGDRASEADALTALGEVYSGVSQSQKSLVTLNLALAIEQSLSDAALEAVTLNDLGDAEFGLSHSEAAMNDYQRALALEREQGRRRYEALTLTNIGTVYWTTGQPLKALDFYNQALPIQELLNTRIDEAVTLQAIGDADANIGKIEDALMFYNRALLMNQEIHSRVGEAITLHAIGALYITIGQPKKALEFLGRALPLERLTGDRQAEAYTITGMAGAYAILGRPLQARELYLQELPVARALGDTKMVGIALHNIGTTYQLTGQPRFALRYFAQALPVDHQVGDVDAEAYDWWRIADAENSETLRDYFRAIYLAQSVGDLNLQGKIYTSLMNYFAVRKQTGTAIFFGKEAVNNYQEIRANMQGLQNKTQDSFVQSKADSYRRLAKLLIVEGRIVEAEHVIKMLKEQEFFEFMSGTRTEDRQLDPTSLSASESQAETITADEISWAGLDANPHRSTAETLRMNALAEKLRQNNQEFRNQLQNMLRPQVTMRNVDSDTTSIQTVLKSLPDSDAETVGVYTLVLETELDLVVVTKKLKVIPRVVPISRDRLLTMVTAFRKELQDPCGDPKPLASQMFNLVIKPILPDLRGAGAKTILWELDGPLRLIPIGALYDGKQYVVETYRNVLFPMQNQIGLVSKGEVNNVRALGLGTSIAPKPFEDLPAVATELESIIHDSRVPQSKGPLSGRIFLNSSFTPQIMKDELKAGFPIVHIASHFVLMPGGEKSFLLLGADDPGQPGSSHLSYSELIDGVTYDFSKVQLLTLSACETGTSEGSDGGKEVDALSELMEKGGAKSVLASLWDVNDDSTGELMTEFYRGWVKTAAQGKLEALVKAQRGMLRANHPYPKEKGCKATFSHPYYWAPFILTGNWN